jgi:hypothetical protein
MTLKLGFIGIITNDMAQSLAFYRSLGVSIESGQDEAPHVDAQLGDGTTSRPFKSSTQATPSLPADIGLHWLSTKIRLLQWTVPTLRSSPRATPDT